MKRQLAATLFLLLSTHCLAAGSFRKDAKTSQTTTTTTTTTPSATTAAEESSHSKEEKSEGAVTKNSKLTGIPQVDYVYDPNLPRELRGYNLSSYPFLSTVPIEEDIHFKCDGLHDGFYASIEYKCQVYHHCVYGIRHDFLCANFTAFDQKTFICHFASDVDCEGSKKYWNRNDDLYMATTTTSTTTTTTEPPPPTMRRRPARPMRPLRRPYNRRPVDDYYYDDYYQDEYFQEPLNRRRVPGRMRPKKPLTDYDEDYDRDIVQPEEIENPRRNPNYRYRFRENVDEVEADYDAVRPHGKGANGGERRKPGGRLPNTGGSAARPAADERRSFADDRPLDRPLRKDKPRVQPEEAEEEEVLEPRRYSARRRANEKRAGAENLHVADQEAEEVKDDKQRTSPRPLEEFITPKAASQSVYARPRVPPRISRPVPMNEKNKFQYPVQKSGTTAPPSSTPIPDEAEEEYYADEDYAYSGSRGQQRRRRIQDTIDAVEERPSGRKRYRQDPPLTRTKPLRARNQLRKPVSEKKVIPAAAYEDYEVAEEEPVEVAEPVPQTSGRRPSPYIGRRRSSATPATPAEDVDFEDVDYYAPGGKPKNKLKASPITSRKKTVAQAGKSRRPPANEDIEVVDSVEEEAPLHVARKGAQKASVAVPDDPQDSEAVVEEEPEAPAGKKRLYSPILDGARSSRRRQKVQAQDTPAKEQRTRS